jgi:hypothetical protein
MATDYTKDLFDEYGRPIIVAAATTQDVSQVLFDDKGRPVKVIGT